MTLHAPETPASRPDTVPETARIVARGRIADEQAMTALAERLGAQLNAGDTLLLDGPIGSGKTHFARALIRHAFGEIGPALEVPSPSFTLVQSYAAPRAEIWHADLYRLADPQELVELGLEDARDSAICLIEWPSRADVPWSSNTALLQFQTPPGSPDERILTLWGRDRAGLAQRLLPAWDSP